DQVNERKLKRRCREADHEADELDLVFVSGEHRPGEQERDDQDHGDEACAFHGAMIAQIKVAASAQRQASSGPSRASSSSARTQSSGPIGPMGSEGTRATAAPGGAAAGPPDVSAPPPP